MNTILTKKYHVWKWCEELPTTNVGQYYEMAVIEASSEEEAIKIAVGRYGKSIYQAYESI